MEETFFDIVRSSDPNRLHSDNNEEYIDDEESMSDEENMSNQERVQQLVDDAFSKLIPEYRSILRKVFLVKENPRSYAEWELLFRAIRAYSKARGPIVD